MNQFERFYTTNATNTKRSKLVMHSLVFSETIINIHVSQSSIRLENLHVPDFGNKFAAQKQLVFEML